MPFKMSLRKRAKKIPNSELVVFYEAGIAEKKGTPEIVDLMARAVISAKRKYASLIAERNIWEKGRVIDFRITMLLKPAKKKEKEKKK